jgi:cytosol alanyl aminopeptidase
MGAMPSAYRASLALAALLTACSARQPVPTPEPEAQAPQAQARTPAPPPAAPTLRLPDTVRPTGYSLELTVDPAASTFQGVAEISLQLREPTTVVWLHGRSLEVKEASLRVGGQVLPTTVVQGGESFLGFVTEQPLPAGPALLRVAYVAPLSETELNGAFRAQEKGEWYAFTQFEPLGARRAFPCFDEPGFKVPWQLTFHVPQGSVAVTNTPELSREERPGGGTTFRFARTQPLPSYLIAFGVGPFEFLPAAPAGQKGVATRIVTPKGRAAEGAWAARVTPEILGHLEHYFGSPYPYEKLDVLAVFHLVGAMEHPGLITFGSELLLAKEAEDFLQRQRGFYAVQVHELAHQWFGNLVTLAWWDDLWLNEAFATWMTPRIVEVAQPAWDAPLERVRKRSSALEADALITARRIRQPIASEGDILNAFDGITYGKGAAVLAMTESWLGREPFQRGIQRYLRAHAGGSATAHDFFAALSAEAGQDVAGVLGTFLDQGGAPLVSATLDCRAKVPVVRLAQRRYLPLGSAGEARQTWKVPLCVRYGTAAWADRACTVLETESAELPLPTAKGCPTWLLPNADGAGYLRAMMDGQALGRLLTAGRRHLSRAERVAMLGDMNALVKAGMLPAADALALLPTLAREKDRQVLSAGLALTSMLGRDMLPESRWESQERFLRNTFGPRARALGLVPRKGEEEDTRLIRPMLVQMAAELGRDPKLVAEARALALKWLEDPGAVAPDMVDTVLAVAASRGGPELQKRLLVALRQEKAPAQRQRLLGALASVEDPVLVREQLGLLLEPEADLRELDLLLFGAASITRTRDVAYSFLQEHYEALKPRMSEELVASLAWLGAGYCDPVKRQEVAAFFSERSAKAPGGERVLAQVLERVDLCITLKAAQGCSVESFLAAPKVNTGVPR